MQQLGTLPPEVRPLVGRTANEIKQAMEAAFESRGAALSQEELRRRLTVEHVDVTLPGTPRPLGAEHPVTQVLDEIKTIFCSMGFRVFTGPDIETDYYNFEALNFPKDHPARDMQDTFYLPHGLLLRTHTSPVQIHAFLGHQPPIAVLAPGTVYRCDADVTHSPMFHQVEGFVVDRHISFSDLIGTLDIFLKQMFGPEIRYRFSPSFFPFTEPSAEVAIQFPSPGGGAAEGNGEGNWLEILGCGMIHPAVFEKVGYDPEVFTGFAFGMGVERIAMLKHGIKDIRLFFENDVRFLRRF
jgi:phenylalanyl-tRNA synthetase alpha chain